MAKKKGETPDAVVESDAVVLEEAVVEDDAVTEDAAVVEDDAVSEDAAVVEDDAVTEDAAVEQPAPDAPEVADVADEPATGADLEPEPQPEPVHYVPFADQQTPRPVLHTRRSFTGRVWDVTSDLVNLGDAGVVTRDYVHHPGAVAIIAMNADSQIYLVRQYRHPVRTETWEPPAGLLDVRGEDPLEAAKRELHEEADLTAGRWDVLIDFFTSPGGSSEGIRMYLARDLASVPEDERHEREGEERDMVGAWVDLPSILNAIQRADIAGPTLLLGAFALDAAVRSEFATLRPADSPWRKPPARGEH